MSRSPKVVYEYRIYDITPARPFLSLSGEHWRISDVLSPRLHFHNCLEIGFCRSDSGFIGLTGGRKIDFRAGDIFMIPRHVPHTTCSAPGVRSLWNYLFVDLRFLTGRLPEDLPLLTDEQTMGLCLRIRGEENPRIHFLAEALLEECRLYEQSREEGEKPENAGNHSLCRLYGATLSTELLRMNPAAGKALEEPAFRSFILKPALDYIHDHYMDRCDIPELSSLCHLSESHFRRIFVDIMGEPPLQFVTRTRIREACSLLDTTGDAVLSISQAVGIPSISSFNRNFHDFMGVSPREYRSRRAGEKPGDRSVLAYQGWFQPEETPLGGRKEKI